MGFAKGMAAGLLFGGTLNLLFGSASWALACFISSLVLGCSVVVRAALRDEVP